MILGGLSVLGEPVRVKEPVRGVVGLMVSKMGVELRRNCPKLGEQAAWLQHYLEKGKGDEIEHIAFLSLWLSRFVLVEANGKAIRESVFQVAVRLALGTRIALAPAVLASIYRDLGLVKEHLNNKSAGLLAVWSPMNIVQMWLWERFPALRPNSKSVLGPDMPRALRWHITGKIMNLSAIMDILASPDGFRWRPYAVEELATECRPFFYMNDGGWFVSDVTKDEELQSFAQCLRACELVGLDCIEQYLPHRVAMQFALDQQVPKSVPRANSTWEIAWKTYDMSSMSVELYVPPRLFESAATVKYTNWWRYIRRRDMAAGKKRKAGQKFKSQKKKLKKTNAITASELSARWTLKPHEIKTEDICSKTQEQEVCTVKLPHAELRGLNATGKVESVSEGSEKQQREDLAPLSVNDKGIAEVIEKTNGERSRDFTAIEKSREANEKQQHEEFPPEPDPFDEERVIEVVKKKELSRDLTVTESKKEIEKQREESRPEPVSLDEERITEVVKKIKPLQQNITTTDKSKEENEKQRLESQRRPLCISELGVMKCSLNTNAGVDNKRTAAKKPESEVRRAETEAIGERDLARLKELEHEPKHRNNETSEIEERDSVRRKELERKAKHKREETKATEQMVQTDLARKNRLQRESKRQIEKRIVTDPAKELERDRRICQLKGEIASILAQIRYWESVAEAQEQSNPELTPCPP